MRKEADMQDSDLDDLFGQARQPVAVPAALMARVLSDADALQPVAPVRPRKARLWQGLWAGIGGFGGLAGLSTAAMAGLWIGFAQPTALVAVTDAFLPVHVVAEAYNILPGFDEFLDEG